MFEVAWDLRLARTSCTAYVRPIYTDDARSVVRPSVFGTPVSPAKAVEPIEMRFREQTRVDRRNHVSDGNAHSISQSVNQSCIFRVVQVIKPLQDPLAMGHNLTGIDDNVRERVLEQKCVKR